MKIFIAGARSITTMDSFVLKRLHSICDKHFDVLVGDCYGVDTAVQSFFLNILCLKMCMWISQAKRR